MSSMVYRGISFADEVGPLVAHMPAVDEYRETLLRLQGIWDSLAMLGQMSGTLPDIGATRGAFSSLTGTLLDNLARQLRAHQIQVLQARAQVAIDILVRNLFERTADVGFLSTDQPLCEFTATALTGTSDPGQRQALEVRFKAYVAKYSVYDDIIVLDPQGRVLARLDHSVAREQANEPWLKVLEAGQPYAEHYGPTALLDGRCGLIYAAAIRSGGRSVGTLCLSFRLVDEMRGVFGQLLDTSDTSVLVLLDADRKVVASSDAWQVPVGATLADPLSDTDLLRFAGRQYLSVAAQPSGYEGYGGPGWFAQGLLPLELAFPHSLTTEVDQNHQPALEQHSALAELTKRARHLDTKELFDDELQSIPEQARNIQRELSRVLWNGRLRPPKSGISSAFAATLLHEVGNTGERIRSLFESATRDLHQSALAAVLDQSRDEARLAIDIMDRNLYERANDCRWWALDAVLQHTLAQTADQRSTVAANAVLERINGLYTVYTLLLLFDTEGRVVAASRPDAHERIGQRLDAEWVGRALALHDPEHYVVSAHEPSALYGDRSTYVFAAALHAPGDAARNVGGIAIVFDGAPQFAAMLRDALPPAGSDGPASSGLFVTRGGEVVASTDPRWSVGDTAPTLAGLATLPRGEAGSTLIEIDGVLHAASYRMTGGYREYHCGRTPMPDDVAALALVRLGQQLASDDHAMPDIQIPRSTDAAASAEGTRDIAVFAVDGQWLGLPVDNVVEATEHPRIAAVPSASSHVLGLLIHQDQTLPVLDLARVRQAPPPRADEATVIVLRTNDGHPFAIRVKTLGPVFQIPESLLQVVPGHEDASLIRGLGPMITLLEADALYRQVGSGV